MLIIKISPVLNSIRIFLATTLKSQITLSATIPSVVNTIIVSDYFYRYYCCWYCCWCKHTRILPLVRPPSRPVPPLIVPFQTRANFVEIEASFHHQVEYFQCHGKNMQLNSVRCSGTLPLARSRIHGRRSPDNH